MLLSGLFWSTWVPKGGYCKRYLINGILNAVFQDQSRAGWCTRSKCSTDPELPGSPTLCEAMVGPEREKWRAAILEELTTGNWELVNHLPVILNVTGCCCVLHK